MMNRKRILSFAIGTALSTVLCCSAGTPNVADELKHPHGAWTSVTNGVSIALGPRDSNTFVNSDICLNIYVKIDGDTPPELLGNGLQLDIAIPEVREGVRPHVGSRFNESLSWKKTAATNVYMAALYTVTLTPGGRWGAAMKVPLKVNGKIITVTTETYYFTVR